MNVNYDTLTLILDQVKVNLFLRYSCRIYKNVIKERKVRCDSIGEITNVYNPCLEISNYNLVRSSVVVVYIYRWKPNKNLKKYIKKLFRQIGRFNLLRFYDINTHCVMGIPYQFFYEGYEKDRVTIKKQVIINYKPLV